MSWIEDFLIAGRTPRYGVYVLMGIGAYSLLLVASLLAAVLLWREKRRYMTPSLVAVGVLLLMNMRDGFKFSVFFILAMVCMTIVNVYLINESRTRALSEGKIPLRDNAALWFACVATLMFWMGYCTWRVERLILATNKTTLSRKDNN